MNKLTTTQVESMATEIRTLLLNACMWQDVDIYFNEKCFSTHDKITGEYHYNDPDRLTTNEHEDPRNYFEYVADDHILSMAFEGPVYEMVNGYGFRSIFPMFRDIFKKYGVCYEQGDAWNLSCYYEGGKT